MKTYQYMEFEEDNLRNEIIKDLSRDNMFSLDEQNFIASYLMS